MRLQSVSSALLTRQYPVLTPTPAPAAPKKKQGASSTEADDLFGEKEDDSLFGDDLFGSSKPSTVQPTHVDAVKRTDFPPHNPSVPAPRNYDRSPPLGVNVRVLAADDKKARFEELYQFAASCIADKTEPARQMRTSAWHHLFSLAGTPEELERVAELFPKWRDARRSFRPATPVQFAREYTAVPSFACP